MQYYKHYVSNKYKNALKAAALSIKYKRCFTNSYQKNLIPTRLCLCEN